LPSERALVRSLADGFPVGLRQRLLVGPAASACSVIVSGSGFLGVPEEPRPSGIRLWNDYLVSGILTEHSVLPPGIRWSHPWWPGHGKRRFVPPHILGGGVEGSLGLATNCRSIAGSLAFNLDSSRASNALLKLAGTVRRRTSPDLRDTPRPRDAPGPGVLGLGRPRDLVGVPDGAADADDGTGPLGGRESRGPAQWEAG
jgi:hypothetical protein